MLLRDGVTHHPKILSAGPEAAWLWVCAIDYSRQHLTDGHIAGAVLRTLGTFRTPMKHLAQRLVDVQLFVPEEDGYTVKDFLEHNDSRAVVLAKRRADSERKKGNHHANRSGIQADSERIPTGIQSEQNTLARARVRVGVGTVSDDGSGSDGRGGAGENHAPLAADVYELWRTVAHAHGTDLRLGVSATDTRHCMALADAYSLAELEPAMTTWWASAHTGGRNLGLFVAQLPEVLAWRQDHPRRPFRAPPARAAVEAEAPAHGWQCPHEPACASQFKCIRRQQLDAVREA